MVLPTNLSGPQTDADNRAWHEELRTKLPALNLPAVAEGGTGHLDHHEILNLWLNQQTGSTLPTTPAEGAIDHEKHHNLIHLYVNNLTSGTTYAVPTSIDYSGTTDVTVALTNYLQNTVPNGTQANPTVVVFPAGARYLMNGGVRDTGQAGAGLELVDKSWTTYLGPVEFFANNLGHANEDPNTGGSINNNRVRYHVRVQGGVGLTFKNITVTSTNTTPTAGTVGGTYEPRYEAQHCFDLAGTDQTTIEDCLLRYPWGDHIHASSDPRVANAAKWCTNLVIRNCEMHTNGRQGVALTAADTTLVTGCNIYNTRRATFDLEPDNDVRGCTNATIENNTIGIGQLLFIANAGAAGRVENIIVRNNTLTRSLSIFSKVRDTGIGLRRRGPWLIEGNVTTDGGQPPDGGGSMTFFESDGITIQNNTIPVRGYSDKPTRNVYGVSIEKSCGLVMSGNNWTPPAGVNGITAEVINLTPSYVCP